MPKEAEILKEHEVLGLIRCFPAEIEKTSKNHQKMAFLGFILEILKIIKIWLKISAWNLELWISHEILLL